MRRLPYREEGILNNLVREERRVCIFCHKPITQWVQVGSEWLDAAGVRCRFCNRSHVADVHHSCAPFYLQDHNESAFLGLFRAIQRRRGVLDERNRVWLERCWYCDLTMPMPHKERLRLFPELAGAWGRACQMLNEQGKGTSDSRGSSLLLARTPLCSS